MFVTMANLRGIKESGRAFAVPTYIYIVAITAMIAIGLEVVLGFLTVTGSLIAAGKLKPAIDRRFPLSQIVDALRWVDDGHAAGKVIVKP